MILAEINKTELECQRVGLTIIMRRGQMSITMIVSPDSLESIIRELGNQLSIIRAFNDLGLDRREIRKIANHSKITDKDG
jgi:hypothetical protein